MRAIEIMMTNETTPNTALMPRMKRISRCLRERIGSRKIAVPTSRIRALKRREIAQVKGMKWLLSATAEIRRSAARMCRPSMAVAQNRATPMIGVTTSRVIAYTVYAINGVKTATDIADHSTTVWKNAPVRAM